MMAPASESGASGFTRLDQIKQMSRRTTVYDSVAGRVNFNRNLCEVRQANPANKNHNLRDPCFTPEDVLIIRKGMPSHVVYGPTSLYATAADDLTRRGERLPDSDMLVAMHSYASHFYDRRRRIRRRGLGRAFSRSRSRSRLRPGRDEGVAQATTQSLAGQTGMLDNYEVDERSMDETALLAFGVLLEEAGREVLKRGGDMVFTEGIEDGAKKRGEMEKVRSDVRLMLTQVVSNG